MERELLQRAESVFDALVDLIPEEREAALGVHCGDDDDLRALVQKLLASHDSETLPLLRTPVYGVAPSLPGGHHGDSPKRIGRYRIIRPIGEGGMGVVYLAEQTEPFHREVALKLIRFGMDTKQVLGRFESERQALAMMNHPNVAKVYDAGVTEDNRPFYAMEYVPGVAITEYCERNGLSVRGRVALLVRVCHGIQHAHQKGIIHRDLKPRNILADDQGQPKILDFGVARLTNSDVHKVTMQTEAGQLVGTLPYMSPEQVSGVSSDVDTRSDVYSLGVICYRLLAGSLPYHLDDNSIPDAVRVICEQQPTRLSSINSLLRGDLETIIIKALEKDKTRRYQSASELAADLSNYLEDRPIAARPPTTFYQFKMFARRNRALVGGTLATILALVIGATATAVQASRATRERDHARQAELIAEQRRDEAEAQRAEAQRSAAIAQAVNDFLNKDLLAAAQPDEMGRDVTVREVLARAADTVSARFADQPLVEGAVHSTLGQTQVSLGEYALAETHHQRAFEIYTATLGSEHRYTLNAYGALGNVYSLQGRYDEAEPILSGALDALRMTFGEEHEDTLGAMYALAMLRAAQGRSTEAETLYVSILETRRRLHGDEGVLTLSTAGNLADLYQEQGQHAKAESLYLEIMDITDRVFGEKHPIALGALHDLGTMYSGRGRFREAEPLLVKSLELRRRALGDEHPRTLITANQLAVLYRRQGRHEEAETLYNQVLEARRRILGDEHPHTLSTMNSLANLYARQGRLDEAEPLHRNVVEVRQRTLGDDHSWTISAMGNLATIYSMQERFHEAEPLLTRVLEIQRASLGEEHARTLITMNNMATLMENMGRSAEARVLHERTLEIRRRVLGERHPDTLMSVHNLGKLHGTQGRFEDAARLHRVALNGRREVLGNDNRNTLASMYELAVMLVALQKFDEAEPLAREFHERIVVSFGPRHVQTRKAIALLVELHDSWHTIEAEQGHDAKAAAYRALLPSAEPTKEDAATESRPVTD